MRPFVWGGIAAALLWLAFFVSPYWSFWRFAVAVEGGDTARIVEIANLRAVRVSLARAIVGEAMADRRVSRAVTGTERDANAIAVAAEPLLETLVTPEGLGPLVSDLRTRGAPADGFTGRRTGWNAGSLSGLGRILAASRWRGFRNVYFTVPPQAPANVQFRLQFRLSRLAWRLVSIDLPAESRARFAEDVTRRLSARPGEARPAEGRPDEARPGE